MKYAIFLFSILLSGFINAQKFQTSALDRYLENLESENLLSGNIAVSQAGITVYQKSVGYADAEKGIKNSAATRFRIGSVSKTFTAVLTLLAVQEGKLALNQKLSDFYPQVKNSEKITVENLLNHSSGIKDFTGLPSFGFYYMTPVTQQKILEEIVKAGIGFEPGADMEYSNSNYVLLSYILEKIYGKSYAELLALKITKPLGLNNIYVGSKIDPQKNEAFSYMAQYGSAKSFETDMSIPSGAGAVVSTTADLLKFIEALFEGKLLSARNLKQMITLNKDYGYGVFSVKYDDLEGFGHNGAIDQFNSELLYFPEKKLSIAVLSNGSSVDLSEIRNAALDACHSKDVKIAEPVKVDPVLLKSYTGTYASSQIPLKITVTQRENQIFARATGQSEFPLTATDQKTFVFKPVGITITFSLTGLQIVQGNNITEFKKETD